MLVTSICALATRANAADSDSLRIIHSFYRSNLDQGLFATSTNGDTVVLAYTASINHHHEVLDTTHIQIRNWNTLTAKTILNQDFYHVQLSTSPKLYALGNIGSIPHLLYTPTVDTIKIVELYKGATTQTLGFPDSISKIYQSPDFTHAFIVTKNDRFYVVNLAKGEFILRDSVQPMWKLEHPRFDTLGTYDVHYKVACETFSWCRDNSIVLIRQDSIIDSTGTDRNSGYYQFWRPYDVVNKRFVTKPIPNYQYGRWQPNAKAFITFTAKNLYYTDLTLQTRMYATGKFIYDFGFRDSSSEITIVEPSSSISIWRLDNGTNIADYATGQLQGYTFNRKGDLLAYISEDSSITVVNTEKRTGVFKAKIDFPHAVTTADPSSFKFINGDKAIAIADTLGQFRILDLIDTTIVAIVDASTRYNTCPDGTSLFLQNKQIRRINLFDGKTISVFPDNELLYSVKAYALSPDSKSLATIDTIVRVYDSRSGVEQASHWYNGATSLSWPATDSLFLVHRLHEKQESITGVRLHAVDSVYHIDVPNGHFLGLSANAKDILIGDADTVRIYSATTGSLRASVNHSAGVSAAYLSENDTTLSIGDSTGYIRILNRFDSKEYFTTKTRNRIRALSLSAQHAFLSYINDDGNVLIGVPSGKQLQMLTTPTLGTFFNKNDSLCFCIYDEAVIEFYTSNGHPTKINCNTRPSFRPQLDFYAVGNPNARDSFALFDYAHRRLDRGIPNRPVKREIIWSRNGTTLATVDIFNNIIIWTPGNLPKDVIPVNAVEDENEYSVRLFPQPAESWVRTDASADKELQEVELVDMIGQRYTCPITDTQRFSVANLSSGVYVARMHWTDGTHSTLRLVVRH